jgi:hypothetical protein
MQFELLRLLMVDRAQPGLFPRLPHGGGTFTREEWLRDVFGQEIDFEHRGGRFHYSPVRDHDGGSAVLVGLVGTRTGRKNSSAGCAGPRSGTITTSPERIWSAMPKRPHSARITVGWTTGGRYPLWPGWQRRPRPRWTGAGIGSGCGRRPDAALMSKLATKRNGQSYKSNDPGNIKDGLATRGA